MNKKPKAKKSKRAAGIDIGSRTIKLVIIEEDKVVLSLLSDTTHDPRSRAKEMLQGREYDALLATGYGRGLMEAELEVPTVTELKAYSAGALHLYPQCRTVLDIGGQDTKVISLDGAGRIVTFEINDRCAAGTGKFLEVMAEALGFTIDQFGEAALSAKEGVEISNTCTVFAESEVVGLLARGARPEEVALGLHQAVARRVLAMLKRLPTTEGLVFAGGGAKNPALIKLLRDELGDVSIPPEPQSLGALGAALFARGK